MELVLDRAQLLGGRAARHLASSMLKLRLEGVGGPSSGNQSTYPSLHPIFEKYLNISDYSWKQCERMQVLRVELLKTCIKSTNLVGPESIPEILKIIKDQNFKKGEFLLGL